MSTAIATSTWRRASARLLGHCTRASRGQSHSERRLCKRSATSTRLTQSRALCERLAALSRESRARDFLASRLRRSDRRAQDAALATGAPGVDRLRGRVSRPRVRAARRHACARATASRLRCAAQPARAFVPYPSSSGARALARAVRQAARQAGERAPSWSSRSRAEAGASCHPPVSCASAPGRGARRGLVSPTRSGRGSAVRGAWLCSPSARRGHRSAWAKGSAAAYRSARASAATSDGLAPRARGVAHIDLRGAAARGAAAIATLDVLSREQLPERAPDLGARSRVLDALASPRASRACAAPGSMLGIELDEWPGAAKTSGARCSGSGIPRDDGRRAAGTWCSRRR